MIPVDCLSFAHEGNERPDAACMKSRSMKVTLTDEAHLSPIDLSICLSRGDLVALTTTSLWDFLYELDFDFDFTSLRQLPHFPS